MSRGIILIKALVIAGHSSEYAVVRQSTRGIVFLATPFRGTSFQDVADWAEPGLRAWALIRGQKVSSLLDDVKGSTFHLEELVRKFTHLCHDKDYPCQVITFYELGLTSLHRKFPLSWLIPSGLLDLVVSSKPVSTIEFSAISFFVCNFMPRLILDSLSIALQQLWILLQTHCHSIDAM